MLQTTCRPTSADVYISKTTEPLFNLTICTNVYGVHVGPGPRLTCYM